MEIQFDKEVREGLVNGVNKLSNAVKCTMGPNGNTVIIPDAENYGKYKVTKDGVSVAREIYLQDPIENIGAQLVKQAAEETLEKAGDGTTTSTVLSQALINNLKEFSSNNINKTFDEIIPKVLIELKNESKKLRREDILHVASISANNDLQIGNIINKAFRNSDIVKIKKSSNIKDDVLLINGMSLEVGYFSKHFVTNTKKAITEFENPLVLIVDGKIEKLDQYRTILEYVAEENKSLLIITEHIHEQSLRKLETLVLSNNIKLCIIKTPGFGPHRKDLIKDLSIFTNSTVIDTMKAFNANYPKSVLGTLESCSISKTESVLTKSKEVNIDEYLLDLESQLSELDKSDLSYDLLKQRIEYLKGSISIISVGGNTENEMNEKYDRYDDAVKAVKCALEEGIVQGGGLALYWTTQKVASTLKNLKPKSIEFNILQSLNAPVDIIGIPVNTDMFKLNIVDPLKVTNTALLNAVAVTKTILSTNAVVLNKDEWKI
jgi:chaperonin GroEL